MRAHDCESMAYGGEFSSLDLIARVLIVKFVESADRVDARLCD